MLKATYINLSIQLLWVVTLTSHQCLEFIYEHKVVTIWVDQEDISPAKGDDVSLLPIPKAAQTFLEKIQPIEATQ